MVLYTLYAGLTEETAANCPTVAAWYSIRLCPPCPGSEYCAYHQYIFL